MSGNLRRLCYFSRSLIQGSAAARVSEVERLLFVSRIVNARFGITGMLLSSEDCFAQILEGTPDAVGEIFGRIERDWRHTGVTLLHDKAVASRAFADWAMVAVNNIAMPHPCRSSSGPLYERLAGILSQDAMN